MLAGFSHVFILASSGKENLNCDSDDINLVDWTCRIPSSYLKTVKLLLTGDLAYDNESAGPEKMTPTILFGFFMGIVFLNISIAVITDTYNKVQVSESRAFTRNRLSFAAGSQTLVSILLINYLWKGITCSGNSLRLWKSKKVKFEERARNSKHISLQSMMKREEINKGRIAFEVFPEWSFLEQQKGEDSLVLNWWFVPWDDNHPLPPLCVRLKVFFKRSSLNDIFFPGDSFESLLMGVSQHEDKTKSLVSFLAARVISYLLFFILTSAVLIVFIAGSVSFGLLWPDEMRDFLFNEKICDDDEKKGDE